MSIGGLNHVLKIPPVFPSFSTLHLGAAQRLRTLRKSRGLIFVLSLIWLLTACRPSQNPAILPSPSETPPVQASPLPTNTVPPADETPVPVSTNTAVPEILPTFTPTQLPPPPYTHMGMELISTKFVQKVPMALDAGAGWIRWNGIFWGSIESQEGLRNWEQVSDFETYAQAVSGAGMNLIAIVRRTPAWAQAAPGYLCGPILPEKLESFGRFMYDLVARYSQPPYNVKYWELGNEPDVAPSLAQSQYPYGCWGDLADPYYGGRYYAEMLKIAYPQIKAADPTAQVLVGGLLLDCDPNNPPLLATGAPKDCTPARFLEGILLAGGGSFFDGISFHAYDYYWNNASGFINGSWGLGQTPGLPASYYKAAYLRNLLSAYEVPNKYLLNTETALLCGRNENEAICKTDEFNQIKANYVLQSYAVAKGEGLLANIWFHYEGGWRFSGLVSESFDPYPAVDAYRLAAQMLDGTLPFGKVEEFPNVIGYKFLNPTAEGHEEFWVIWSLDGLPTSLTLPQQPVQLMDVYGNPLPLSQTLEITAAPIYVQIK